MKKLYIFGIQRSGTTALATSIGAHSDVNMLNEASDDRNLNNLIGKKYQANKLTVGRYLFFDKKATKTRNFIHLKIDRIIQFFNKNYKSIYKAQFSIKDLIKDKDCKIIIIYRDKEKNIESILRWRPKYSRKEAEREYEIGRDIFAKIALFYTLSNIDYYTIEYKLFTRHPEITLREICDYLEIEFEKRMLSGCQYDNTYKNDKIFENE